MKKFVLVLAGVLSSSVVEAKLSSNKLEKQDNNIKAVISACKFNKNVLNDIKSKAIGSSVTSGIASAASAGATALSFGAVIKSGKMIDQNINPDAVSKKDDRNDLISKDNVKTLKNLRLGSTIASGVATGANLASVALNGTSAKQLAELMDNVSNCKSALDAVSLSAE